MEISQIRIKDTTFIIELIPFTNWLKVTGRGYTQYFVGYSLEEVVGIIEKDNFRKY